jgi:hypothetical protein
MLPRCSCSRKLKAGATAMCGRGAEPQRLSLMKEAGLCCVFSFVCARAFVCACVQQSHVRIPMLSGADVACAQVTGQDNGAVAGLSRQGGLESGSSSIVSWAVSGWVRETLGLIRL